jgi:hypothetical protein
LVLYFFIIIYFKNSSYLLFYSFLIYTIPICSRSTCFLCTLILFGILLIKTACCLSPFCSSLSLFTCYAIFLLIKLNCS